MPEGFFREFATENALKRIPPVSYISSMLNQIITQDPCAKLGYVVIGGSVLHMNEVKEIFDLLKIPLIGECTETGNRYIVVPNSHEVIMFGSSCGYLRFSLLNELSLK